MPAFGAVERLTVTVAPGVPARAVAEVVTAARDAGAGRVDVRGAEGERAAASEAVSVRAESLADEQLAGLGEWLPAVAPDATVPVADDVTYGRVARVEALLIELGLPRVAFHRGTAAAGG